MSVVVRAAGSDDVAALVGIDPYAQINAERRTQIEVWVESGQCFVAERDGETVGYSVLTKHFFHSFFVDLLMVAEVNRRSGVGTAMIEHLIGLIPPGEKLWTSTNESNAPMRAPPAASRLHSERANRQSRRGRPRTRLCSTASVVTAVDSAVR